MNVMMDQMHGAKAASSDIMHSGAINGHLSGADYVQNAGALVNGKGAPSSAGYSVNLNSQSIANPYSDEANKSRSGKTLADLSNDAQATQVAISSEYMTVMSSSVSGADLKKLQEEGYDLADMTPEESLNTLEHIKATLASSGVVIRGFNDDLSSDQLREVCGSAALAESVQKHLTENDTPVTKENVLNVMDALEDAQSLHKPTDGELQLLLRNEEPLTIRALYMNQHSGSAHNSLPSGGYYAQGAEGYYAKKSESDDLSGLEGQIRRVYEKAGIPDFEWDELSDESKNELLERAGWMIRNGIELTPNKLALMNDISKIEFPISDDIAIAAGARGLAEGEAAIDGNLSQRENVYIRAARLMEQVQQITDDDLKKAVAVTGGQKDINIHVLSRMKELTEIRIPNGEKPAADNMNGEKPETGTLIGEASASGTLNKETSETGTPMEESPEFIHAKRLLEETRLRMSLDANVSLLKKGFRIETAPLSELVEELKAKELELSLSRFPKVNSPEDALRCQRIYDETLEISGKIKDYPLAYTARVDIKAVSLSDSAKGAESLKKELEFAHKTYETFGTQIRKDLGDSIRTAFRNTDEILNRMNLENTTENQRAVRALSYNGMEVNEQAIERVKDADLTLQRIAELLTPNATLALIKNGTNPLNMTLAGLEEALTNQELTQPEGRKADDFASFLLRMQQKGEVSEKEREAYVGIYRLLQQVEKSDGAVIGALVSTDQELTMSSLLRQVRSLRAVGNKKNAFDYEIGDDTKIRVKQSRGMRIDDQISAAFTSERTYSDKLIGSLTDLMKKLDPEQLRDMDSQTEGGNGLVDTAEGEIGNGFMNRTVEETGNGFMNRTVEETGNGFMNRTPEETGILQRDFEEGLQDLRQLADIENEAIRQLVDGRIPQTISNLQASQALLSANGFGRRPNVLKSMEDEKKGSYQEMREVFADKDSSPDEMKKAQQQLVRDLKSELERELWGDDSLPASEGEGAVSETSALGYERVRSIGSMLDQLGLMEEYSRQEHFVIPVDLQEGLAVMHLTLVNEEGAGRVSVSVKTKGGEINAQLSSKDGKLYGTIRLPEGRTDRDREEFLSRMQGYMDQYLPQGSEKDGAKATEADNYALYMIAKAVVQATQGL